MKYEMRGRRCVALLSCGRSATVCYDETFGTDNSPDLRAARVLAGSHDRIRTLVGTPHEVLAWNFVIDTDEVQVVT